MKNVLAKVVMLPTEKATKLLSDNHRIVNPLTEGVAHAYTNNGFKYQHLYFTTDEEIKEGDYIIAKTTYYVPNFPNEGHKKGDLIKLKFYDRDRIFKSDWAKVVASTDESLGLARPSNEFLKAYCEKGGIDELFIEYTNHEQETGEFAHSDEELIYYIKVASNNTIIIK